MIVDELERLVEPLRDGLTSPQGFARLLDDLGMRRGTQIVDALPPAFGDVVTAADALVVAGNSIAPDMKLPEVLATMAPAIAETIVAISSIAELVDDPASLADLAGAMRDGVDAADLADRLLDHLVLTWLRRWHPNALSIVEVLGAVRLDDGAARFDPVELLAALQHPLQTVGGVLSENPDLVVAAIERVLASKLAPVPMQVVETPDGFAYVQPAPTERSRLGLTLPGLGDVISATVSVEHGAVVATLGLVGGSTVDIDLGAVLTLQLAADLEQLTFVLSPAGAEIGAIGSVDAGTLALSFDPPEPWTVIGRRDGTRLELGGFTTTVELDDLASAPRVAVALDVEGLAVVLQAGDSDALMQAIVGSDPVVADMSMSLRYDDENGLVIEGAVGFSVTLAIGLGIGPITLDTIALDATIDGTGLGLDVGLGISGSIGPIAMAVEGIGVEAAVGPNETAIALGDIGLGLGFKPPTAIGLGVDLGVVAGGGFLAIDAEAGVYEGAIQLRVMSVGVSAFVLIETKRPDIDGWSFMMALYIEIPAIQLGFGFVLTGLGGFAGINRGVDPEALGEAVRSGSMNTILFPDDPIADAPLIIDTLAAMFPAADGQYVFGPVVRFGWGTPQLVEVAVGVVIELPDPIRIAMIGTVDALIPRPEAPLVELHLAVAGVIDFEAGTLAIDASLHHSKIVGFDLAGDMALRASFTGQPSFLFSLGGFHPDFEPPTGFPALRRLSIGLSAGSMFRLTFECYMAITSNTVQFGAAFELVAKVSGFGIEGGTEFDALIQFNPFRLKTSIRFYISVTAMNVDLMGVLIRGDLEGPNPWHITGYAQFKVLGIDKEVNVDEIIGSSSADVLPDPPDVLGLLADALQLDDAWAVGTSSADGVTLATSDEQAPGELLVVPHGSIELAQTVVPLDHLIEKFGNAETLVHDRFRLVPSAGLTESGVVTQFFAPAFFATLKPKERLAAPSFESMPGGLAFGGGAESGAARGAPLGYEPILLDSDYERWLEETRHEPATTKRPHVAVLEAGSIVRAHSDDIDLVVGAGSFGVADPVFEVVDAITGTVAASTGTFLAATTTVGDGQVIAVAGETVGVG